MKKQFRDLHLIRGIATPSVGQNSAEEAAEACTPAVGCSG